jgi:hypothetical protein
MKTIERRSDLASNSTVLRLMSLWQSMMSNRDARHACECCESNTRRPTKKAISKLMAFEFDNS